MELKMTYFQIALIVLFTLIAIGSFLVPKVQKAIDKKIH